MIYVPLHSTTNNYHLDNNREVVDAGGVVQQVTNYYPFGAESCNGSTKSYVQNHKYNGKEFDKGCYGLYGGDEEIIRFNNDFQNRWSRCPNDPIKVSVFKRKNVIWHAKGNPWK